MTTPWRPGRHLRVPGAGDCTPSSGNTNAANVIRDDTSQRKDNDVADLVPPLAWKRVAPWDLSSDFQILWKASTPERDYLIARTGRADCARWELFFRYADGTEERFTSADMLRTAKSTAQIEHNRLTQMAALG